MKKTVTGAFTLGLLIGIVGTAVIARNVAAGIERQVALQVALSEVTRVAEELSLLENGLTDEARSLLIKRLASDAATAERLTATGARVTGNVRPLLPLVAKLEEQLAGSQLGTFAVEKLRLVATRQAKSAA